MALKYYVQSGQPISYVGSQPTKMWADFFDSLEENFYKPAASIREADIVLWTGGPDVSPALYGELPHKSTRSCARRDRFDVMAWNMSGNAKLRLGICRGAQFLNVMNGGSLWQDVRPRGGSFGHQAPHSVGRFVLKDMKRKDPEILDTYEYIVTSTHHQMMRPGPEAVVLGYAIAEDWQSMSICSRKSKGATRDGNDPALNVIIPESAYDDDNIMDPEMVFYPKTGSLCIQGHPEFQQASEDFKVDTQLMIMEALECVAS
jgi:GMP synthase-like glutamine amidotransferase